MHTSRQAVPRFNLEPVGLRPGGFAIPLGVESHHGPLQIFALEPEAYPVLMPLPSVI